MAPARAGCRTDCAEARAVAQIRVSQLSLRPPVNCVIGLRKRSETGSQMADAHINPVSRGNLFRLNLQTVKSCEKLSPPYRSRTLILHYAVARLPETFSFLGSGSAG